MSVAVCVCLKIRLLMYIAVEVLLVMMMMTALNKLAGDDKFNFLLTHSLECLYLQKRLPQVASPRNLHILLNVWCICGVCVSCLRFADGLTETNCVN